MSEEMTEHNQLDSLIEAEKEITRLKGELGVAVTECHDYRISYPLLEQENKHLQDEKDSLEQSIHEAIYLILEEGCPIEAAQVLVNSAQADREPLRLSVSEDKAELLTSMGDKK